MKSKLLKDIFYKAVIDQITDAYVVLDENLKVIFGNKSFDSLFEYSGEKLDNTSLGSYIACKAYEKNACNDQQKSKCNYCDLINTIKITLETKQSQLGKNYVYDSNSLADDHLKLIQFDVQSFEFEGSQYVLLKLIDQSPSILEDNRL